MLACFTCFVSAQEKQKLVQMERGTSWQSQVQLTPFRLPLPGKDIEYLDLDNDGDPDVLRSVINGNIEGDTDSDCLMIDRNGDGSYGGEYDLMIDWDDEDSDGLADIQVIADNSTAEEKNTCLII